MVDNRDSFGQRLRRIRKEHGVQSPTYLSEKMNNEYGVDAILRRERGERKIDRAYVEAFCRALKINGRQRQQLLELAKVFKMQFDPWKVIEKSTSVMHLEFWDRLSYVSCYKCFDPIVIPWVFQTERYAYEMLRLHRHDHPTALSGAKTRLRLARAVLERTPLDGLKGKRRLAPIEVNFIMSEDCLYRILGGYQVMLEQINHLGSTLNNQNVNCHILPRNAVLSAPAFANMNLFGTMLVTFETPGGAFHLSDEETIRELSDYYENLKSITIPHDQKIIILQRAKDHFHRLIEGHTMQA